MGPSPSGFGAEIAIAEVGRSLLTSRTMIESLSHSARILCLLALTVLAGCKSYSPVALNLPEWSPDLEQVTTAEFEGNLVKLHNVRQCNYRSSTDYDAVWYDKQVNLDKIRTVDFVMIPFGNVPGLAHTLLSYGFEGDDYVGVSIEVRRKVGESYDPVIGLGPYYPIHYVFADERDLIGRRAIYDLNDVYVYRANATAEQAREMFVDMCKRANQLSVSPEYYNTLTNNCTTNVVRHVNTIAKYEKVPINGKVIFPGYSDRLAYQLGLIASDKPFEETKREARVNELAYIYRDDPNFSRMIRQQHRNLALSETAVHR